MTEIVSLANSLTIGRLSSYLDRINVSNARLAGMQHDLHMSDTVWSTGISMFYVGYIITQIPSSIIMAKGKPRFRLPGRVHAHLVHRDHMHASCQKRLGLLPVPLPGGVHRGPICSCCIFDDVFVVYEAGVASEDGDLACG